jgi:hypothetical protein
LTWFHSPGLSGSDSGPIIRNWHSDEWVITTTTTVGLDVLLEPAVETTE